MDKTIKRISKHEDEQYFKYAGVHLDEHLSYQSHIEKYGIRYHMMDGKITTIIQSRLSSFQIERKSQGERETKSIGKLRTV